VGPRGLEFGGSGSDPTINTVSESTGFERRLSPTAATQAPGKWKIRASAMEQKETFGRRSNTSNSPQLRTKLHCDPQRGQIHCCANSFTGVIGSLFAHLLSLDTIDWPRFQNLETLSGIRS
jgi:hypothetical protein